VICEILKDDGTMARLPDLLEFAREHGLKIGTIRDLIQHRSETEKLIECVADKEVDCAQGRFRLRAFADRSSGDVHLAMSCGEIKAGEETLVRVHEAVCVLDFLDHGSRGHTYSVDFAHAQHRRKGQRRHRHAAPRQLGRTLLAALKKEKAGAPRLQVGPAHVRHRRADPARARRAAKCACSPARARCRAWRASSLEITGYFTPDEENTK
jgi:3,4-dihydroxy 2-butanone 4-phosphate synthase/GTP cyclohydrolase II